MNLDHLSYADLVAERDRLAAQIEAEEDRLASEEDERELAEYCYP